MIKRIVGLAAVMTILSWSTSVMAAELMIFTAKWCGACQQLKAALEKDPDIVAGFSVVVIDIDANKDLARKHRISSIPTLIITEDDGSTRRKVGYSNVGDLRKWLSGNQEPRLRLRRVRL